MRVGIRFQRAQVAARPYVVESQGFLDIGPGKPCPVPEATAGGHRAEQSWYAAHPDGERDLTGSAALRRSASAKRHSCREDHDNMAIRRARKRKRETSQDAGTRPGTNV